MLLYSLRHGLSNITVIVILTDVAQLGKMSIIAIIKAWAMHDKITVVEILSR